MHNLNLASLSKLYWFWKTIFWRDGRKFKEYNDNPSSTRKRFRKYEFLDVSNIQRCARE